MKQLQLSLLIPILFACLTLKAQQAIDTTFQFQTDPSKKLSLYVPSSYDPASPNHLMVGLHPLNTNRWDGQSWRDTLITFAEMNNLILLCPDGGPDGRVNDAIDTAFTSAMIDSAFTWYNLDPDKVFVMGFSWGGLTTYTYGILNSHRFAGFIPIGAAINGLGGTGSILSRAMDKPFYIVHGSNDVPNVRFEPIKTALENAGACVNSLLMNGVGHTIDFPSRNQILTDAYRWVDSVSCGLPATSVEATVLDVRLEVFPQPAQDRIWIRFEGPDIPENAAIEVFTLTGQKVLQKEWEGEGIELSRLTGGIYLLQVTVEGSTFTRKLWVE